MLLEAARIPYVSQSQQPAVSPETTASGHPVVLLQNDYILTTGHNLLSAFDRLEVAEFTVYSLVESTSTGKPGSVPA